VLVIRYWIGDVQDSQGVSASKMTDIVSGGSVNSIRLLTATLLSGDFHSNRRAVRAALLRMLTLNCVWLVGLYGVVRWFSWMQSVCQ